MFGDGGTYFYYSMNSIIKTTSQICGKEGEMFGFNEEFGPEELKEILEKAGECFSAFSTVVMDSTTRKVFQSNLLKIPNIEEDLYTRDNRWKALKRGVMGKCGNIHVVSARKLPDHFLYFYKEDPFLQKLRGGDSFVDEFREVFRYDLLTNCWEKK